MKKYSMYICVLLAASLLVLYFMYCNLEKNYLNMQNKYELLQKTQEGILEENAQLQQKRDELEEENIDLENRLNAWKKNALIEEWQVFYDRWLADRYYEAGKEGRQLADDLRMIHMQHNYISMTGHYLTDEPIYSITIRTREDVAEEIKGIGVENTELINMLQDDYYAEITFDNTYKWTRKILKVEKDLVENVKYYMIDNGTMLCVSQNSKRVYVLSRGNRWD